MKSRRGVWLFSFIVLVLLINVPMVNSWRVRQQLESEGITTTATVVEAKALPENSDNPTVFLVTFRLPEAADPEQNAISAEVSEEAYDKATVAKELEVVYLEGNPSANVVEGQVDRKLGYWLPLLADVALFLGFLLYWKVGRRIEGPLVLLATADVRRSRGESYQVTQIGEEYVVTGEVVDVGDGEITLESENGRQVRLVLGDHTNDVGHQQLAEVRGRVLPR